MTRAPHIRISKSLGDVSESTLRFFGQMGVEDVSMPTRWSERTGAAPGTRPLIPPAQTGPGGPQPSPWDVDELIRVRDRIASFGLNPSSAGLPVSGPITLGLPARDRDIESVLACIESAGKVGLEVLTYNFTALRASEGYDARRGAGRGGADHRDFDHERIRELPPLDSVGEHTSEEMWERFTWFLERVIPVAESAGVRLAVHPNDPPVAEYRGVAQPLCSLAEWKRLIDTVDSPANCLFFDAGVTTQLGEDPVEVIRYFGSRDRIGTIHFRNVHVEKPIDRYVETFIDEGDCDMPACMQALHEVGYRGSVDPDHTPGITDDTPDTRIGWAYAIGQMIAMRDSVTT